MSPAPPSPITELLRAWSGGDEEAFRQLIPLVYPDLKAIANRQMAHARGSQTLQATALVHEAYLRLASKADVSWNDRAHFFAVAAHVMRGILVDCARAQHAAKRGGGAVTVAIEDAIASGTARDIDLLALDQALLRLSALDGQHGKIVELRFFGGLSIEEVATVLHLSPSTVKRDWVLAKTWIRRELSKAAYDA